MAENNTLVDKILALQEKYESLQKQLADPEVIADMKKYVQLNKDYKELEPIIKTGLEYKKMVDELAEAKDIMINEKDDDLRDMAKAEIAEIEPKIPEMEEKIKILLIPADPDDNKNAIIEIRGGTGGDEAAIFAGDLFRMYSKYAEKRGWKLEVNDETPGTAGGYKQIVFKLSSNDEGVYGIMKYESGVHRVQRVPQTETQGRIQTSAASVAVFPEAGEFVTWISNGMTSVWTSSVRQALAVRESTRLIRPCVLPTSRPVWSCSVRRSVRSSRTKTGRSRS